MKKIEIKKLTIESTFKVTLYLMIIPAILLFLMGLGMLVFGLFTHTIELTIMGILYAISSVVVVLLYGVISMLMALIYNSLSKKFGGLELTVIDKTEQHEIIE